MDTKKHSFDLDGTDQESLKRVMRFLSKTQGHVTKLTAIRFALRKAIKGLPK